MRRIAGSAHARRAAAFSLKPEPTLLRSLRRFGIAVYFFGGADTSNSQYSQHERLVKLLKGHVVLAVVESETCSQHEWGPLFEYIATSFYVTGFRPLLINFIGNPKHWSSDLINSATLRALRTGIVDGFTLRFQSR
ncbi:MAG: hypothetical protein QW767_06585 [Thermoprotei archaeon]